MRPRRGSGSSAAAFDQGWDEQRRLTFERQKARGVIPADTELTPRPAELPAWDSLSADEKKVAARLMEANAGFLAHTDAQIGQPRPRPRGDRRARRHDLRLHRR